MAKGRMSAVTCFAKVTVGKEPTRFTANSSLHATLHSHSLEHSLRVGISSETDLIIVMFHSLGRSEAQIVELFVSCAPTNGLKCGSVVHILLGLSETPFCVVHNVIALEGAIIVFVNVAGVEMLSDVKHDNCCF